MRRVEQGRTGDIVNESVGFFCSCDKGWTYLSSLPLLSEVRARGIRLSVMVQQGNLARQKAARSHLLSLLLLGSLINFLKFKKGTILKSELDLASWI